MRPYEDVLIAFVEEGDQEKRKELASELNTAFERREKEKERVIQNLADGNYELVDLENDEY